MNAIIKWGCRRTRQTRLRGFLDFDGAVAAANGRLRNRTREQNRLANATSLTWLWYSTSCYYKYAFSFDANGFISGLCFLSSESLSLAFSLKRSQLFGARLACCSCGENLPIAIQISWMVQKRINRLFRWNACVVFRLFVCCWWANMIVVYRGVLSGLSRTNASCWWWWWWRWRLQQDFSHFAISIKDGQAESLSIGNSSRFTAPPAPK